MQANANHWSFVLRHSSFDTANNVHIKEKSMNRRLRRSARRAFTLMEILLVLAILVVLASMVGVSYSRIQKSMQIQSTRTQLGMLEEAVKAYQIGVGSLPPNLEALLVAPPELANPTKWQGPYLDKTTLPVDAWDQPF